MSYGRGSLKKNQQHKSIYILANLLYFQAPNLLERTTSNEAIYQLTIVEEKVI